MNNREKIAERLKEARNLSGMSQESAAALLNIPRPSISEIESGKRKVSAEEIIAFATLYNVTTSWLLCKDDEFNETIDESLRIAARELSKMSETDRKKLLEILRILPNS